MDQEIKNGEYIKEFSTKEEDYGLQAGKTKGDN